MTKNEVLLQRWFDNDLNDEEMKMLFAALAKSKQLRRDFGSFQTLRQTMHAVVHPAVPDALDRRIGAIGNPPAVIWSLRTSALQKIFFHRIPVPAAAFLVAFFLLALGSIMIFRQTIPHDTNSQFIYVYEMQPIVVQSHFVQ